MTATIHHDGEHDSSIQPIARIEAQDAPWIVPLREYFERNGCRVVVNQKCPEPPAYVIGVGDAEFVKHFFDDVLDSSVKKLAVVYEGDESALSERRFASVKQYYLDPSPLTEKGARDICAFFFTGTELFKNVRKEPPRAKITGVMPKEALREDARRIADEIQKLYHPKKHTKVVHHESWFVRWATWAGVLAVMTVAPLVLYLLTLAASAGLMVLSTKTLLGNNVRWTRGILALSGTYRSLARSMLTISSPLFLLLRQEDVVEDQDRLISILSQVSGAESGALAIFQKSKTVMGGVLNPYGSTEPVGVSDVMALAVEVSRVSDYLGLAASQLETLSQSRRFPFRSPLVSRFTTDTLSKLATVRTTVGYTEKLLTLYPRIAGFRKKQTYLVLLQNSMELRPTGGFIGSIMLLTFVDGKVESLEVQDVYTADGQLKGHVDPPRPIREILGSEHWYLRDSNWDPQFTISGEKAKWFYEKEMNKSVDGVIAVSLPLVTNLLKAAGPVELLDFNERISESNFFAKSLLYTEAGFFPGSTKKKDFLGSLTQALLTRITTDRSISPGLLLSAFEEGIESRDIQFYFSDPELERLVTQWEWHGGVVLDHCQSVIADVRCVGDGIAIVDANLGVNKANFFVTREAASNIVIGEHGDISHSFTLTIRNAATSTQASDWAYVSYIRFLIPKDAKVQTVLLDGGAVPKRLDETTPPPAPYWVWEQYNGFGSIDVVWKTPPAARRQLTLTWVRPSILPSSPRVAYQFTIRKQAGVTPFPWRTVVEHPVSWGVVRESGIAKAGAFEYTTDLAKDMVVRVLFQRN